MEDLWPFSDLVAGAQLYGKKYESCGKNTTNVLLFFCLFFFPWLCTSISEPRLDRPYPMTTLLSLTDLITVLK